MRESVYKNALKIKSVRFDDDGNVVYNGSVRKGNRLDIVIGLPASGKSSALVDVISNEFRSRVIDNDMFKKCFLSMMMGLELTLFTRNHNKSKKEFFSIH